MDPEPVTPQHSARGNFAYILFLGLLFFFMSGNSPNPLLEKDARSILEQEYLERQAFAEWLAGNDTSPDGQRDTSNHTFVPSPIVLPYTLNPYLDSFANQSGPGLLHYHNITGSFHGTWFASISPSSSIENGTLEVPSKPVQHQSHDVSDVLADSTSIDDSVAQTATATEAAPSADSSVPMDPEKNRVGFPWTSSTTNSSKYVSLNLRESFPSQNDTQLAFVKGSMNVEVDDFNLELDTDALHYIPGGTFFMSARARPNSLDLRHLIDVVPSALKNRSANVVLKEMDKRIANFEEIIQAGKLPPTDMRSDHTSSCSFQGFAQLRPLPSNYPAWRLNEYESEIRHATGINSLKPPPIQLSVALHSQDCALDLTVNDATGIQSEKFWSKVLNYAAVLSVILMLQTYFLVKQMESTTTRASISKVAYGAIIMQAGMDGYTLGVHISLGTMIENPSALALLLPAFAASLCGCFFGSRYAGIIKTSEIPSSTSAPSPPPENVRTPAQAAADAAERRQRAEDNNDIPNSDQVDQSLPSTETDSSVDNNETGITTRNSIIQYVGLASSLALFVVSLIYIGWLPFLLGLLYSFWIPQIYHNAKRGYGRRGLSRTYIIGTTLCRLYLPLYAWQCPNNLMIINSSNWVWCLVVYQFAQAGLLLLQDQFGPRFFLPKGVFPEGEQWDWHPILPPQDIENSVGGNAETGKVDCIICFEPIQIYAPSGDDQKRRDSSDSLVSNKDGEKDDLLGGMSKGFNRFAYAVPPCYHIAHTPCLESWLQIKSECPVCRRTLPQM